jgi:DNA-directed RNA polymerase subunit beta
MEMFVLLEFGKIQFEGFHCFIHKGLIKELNGFPKIEYLDQEFEFELCGGEYQLAKPIMKEREVIYQSDTYSLDLYVPARLTQKKVGVGRYINKLYLLLRGLL